MRGFRVDADSGYRWSPKVLITSRKVPYLSSPTDDMRVWDPRRILSLPAAYRLFGNLTGAHRGRIECVETYIRPKDSDRILDCGCGPADLLDYLPDVEYVGIDIDANYVAEARRRYGGRATFRVGPLGPETMTETAHYDLVLAMGVLHHLDDAQAEEFLNLARSGLKPGGRLVTLDPCYMAGQSRMARYIISRDRGNHIRSLEGWKQLVTPTFPSASYHVRHDLLRIPYTHLFMECEAEAT